ncbi:STY1053 family phage-associated protein [Acinetobacter junii]|uniref:STY1053 family phage-associated protein n=1 Tax=Acinetobacter junii TaxID=40215 RepID=UPI0021CD7119|nr:hypothetical protein [Acinetobacter junii]MCU4406497.1 hypothetical protein [Acinetobacter junii]
MTKMVQILLSRPLNVNLGKDENGQPKTVRLVAGFQEVEQSVADNWFVKAHCQEIGSQDAQNGELQAQLDKANADLQILQTQSDAATAQITQLQDDLKDRDLEIKNLKIQLDKAEQTQSDAVKSIDPESIPAETTKTTKAK